MLCAESASCAACAGAWDCPVISAGWALWRWRWIVCRQQPGLCRCPGWTSGSCPLATAAVGAKRSSASEPGAGVFPEHLGRNWHAKDAAIVHERPAVEFQRSSSGSSGSSRRPSALRYPLHGLPCACGRCGHQRLAMHSLETHAWRFASSQAASIDDASGVVVQDHGCPAGPTCHP